MSDECEHDGPTIIDVLDGPWPVFRFRCRSCGFVVEELCSVDRATRDSLIVVGDEVFNRRGGMRIDGKFFSMRVLPAELERWLALGWIEQVRNFIPSLNHDEVLVVYNGSNLEPGATPPVPAGETP